MFLLAEPGFAGAQPSLRGYAAPVYPVAPRYAPAPVLQFNYGGGHERHFEHGHHDYRPEHHFSHGHHGRRHERDYH